MSNMRNENKIPNQTLTIFTKIPRKHVGRFYPDIIGHPFSQLILGIFSH